MSLSRREWENHPAILNDNGTFYHFNEIYLSIQNGKDFSLRKGNGVHFKLCKGLVIDFRITVRPDAI